MLYYLAFLLTTSLILSFFGLLPFSPISLILSSLFIIAICWFTNKIFAKFFKAPTNLESVYISALILSLIITPASSLQDTLFLFWVSVLAMASKYILALNKKHIFNPVAIALILTSFIIKDTASWWVGTYHFLPFVLFGLLIIKKIKRWSLVFSFLLIFLSAILGQVFLNGNDMITTLNTLFFNSPLLFFTFVMLVEPLTTPPSKLSQSLYGAIVGFSLPFVTPELALTLGNIFSYLVSPKMKLILGLKQKTKIASDIYDFTFALKQKIAFSPGQYMEWTLPHKSPDSRGVRRYFTLASSPTEENIRLGIKFYENGSSFKKSLLSMNTQDKITASQLSGEFTLPKDSLRKMVFIAGGIGITPFRSMIKYLVDIRQRRSITLFYANRSPSEIAYQDLFEKAKKEIGIKTVYALTDENAVPKDWQGKVGRINDQMIIKEVPDYESRLFYLSGPHPMVSAFEKTLQNIGIPKKQIKVDFFPGYA